LRAVGIRAVAQLLAVRQQHAMSSTRKVFGLIGAAMCFFAFFVALAGSIFISVSYTQFFQAHCGFPAASLQVSSVFYGALLCGIGFGGCALAASGGFTSHWWRFFRNAVVGLSIFTVLFTLFLR
jgi:hypothetical protein